MGDNRIESFSLPFPGAPGNSTAIPGNNATVTLFDSTTMLGAPVGGSEPYKGIRVNQIDQIIDSFLSVDQASAAAGLKNFASTNNGTNFDAVAAGVATIITAGAVQKFVFSTFGFDDYKITWTAGATGPTVFRGTVECVCGVGGGTVV